MYCSNCGKEISDTASFCLNCGQKIENRVQDTGTMSGAYCGEPVNRGNCNQNKPKRKYTALVVGAIALVGILLLVWIVLKPAGQSEDADQSKGAGQTESAAEQVDPYYDDAVRCMQGTWYGFKANGEECRFRIEGTDCTMIENLSPEVVNMVGTRTLTLDGYLKTTDIKGELQFWFNGEVSDTIFYTYDKNTNSIELTYNGYKLGREDEYNSIKQLIQGTWNDLDWRNGSKGGHCFVFENSEFEMGVYESDRHFLTYAGQFGINFDGKIVLFDDYGDVVYTVFYKYDESKGSIELSYEGNVLEKQ